ncbi:hypothetical protein ACFPVX_17425 [Cohnella faecalis]|uniref:AbiU2 domain-containing protein n=1 Tax=Cohnella faecalis TaxID=2315694 RepID=UPI0011C22FF6|nr:hypothetical protein [Cohnella faecalis]
MTKETSQLTQYVILMQVEVIQLLEDFAVWLGFKDDKFKKVSEQTIPTISKAIRQSLLTNILISTCKLYEYPGRNTANVSLRRFLDYFKQNFDKIVQSPVHKNLTIADIEDDLEKIDELNKAITSTFNLRNKILGHIDINYIGDAGKHLADSVRSRDSLLKLINTAAVIIQKHMKPLMCGDLIYPATVASEIKVLKKSLKDYM